MAVNLTSADEALKSYYLDVVADQLNTQSNPFFAQIKQSTNDVYGKEVRKVCAYGVNGGIGAGTEDGNLPTPAGNNYKQFVAPLKNLYGTIEISDKAVRASENSAGAFVNLLNAEMDGLVKSSSFNLSRMLFGDGSGVIAYLSEDIGSNGEIYLDSVQNLVEGMIIEFRDQDDLTSILVSGKRISLVDRANKFIKVAGAALDVDTIISGTAICIQGSFSNEIVGLKKIVSSGSSIYGVSRTENPWLNSYVKSNAGEITELDIQTAIDAIEEKSGSRVNFIVCSWGVRRALQSLLATNKRVVDTTELAGGYKAMSYNGIPVVADRFCPEGTMYLLNTDDFTMHQLCDWQWLATDEGKILKQVAGKPVYSATLVKYAELICERPHGQGVIKGITEA